LFGPVYYGREATSCLSVFKDTKRREGGERSGPEGGRQREEQRKRNGGGAVRSLGGRVPVMLGKKAKNRTEPEQIGPPPLEKKVVSKGGPAAQNRYIASTLRVSKKYYL
jgi:hypothetical protein